MNTILVNISAVSGFSIILFLLLISCAFSIGLSLYALRIPNNKAANTFGLSMAIIALWVLIKILSLFVMDVELRELLHKINILTIYVFVPLLLLVAIYHTNQPAWFKNRHKYFLFVPSAIIYILIFISPYRNFLFSDFKIAIENGIPVHTFKWKLIYQIFLLYNYLVILATFVVLIRSLFTKDKVFRKQMILFIIGLLIPYIYDVMYLLGYSPINNYNLSAVFISIGNFFIAWSMFGYKFFKLIPVAHYQIVNNMPDIMIITNSEDSVVDINKSGELFFECKKDKIIGISLFQFLKDYQEILENFTKKSANNEISIQKNGQLYHFSITISEIGNVKKDHAKILLMGDITERIKSEIQIKRLSVAIEQAPVAVVITDLIGNIEYVNPAFTKITGYAASEAIGNNPRVLKGNTPPETFTNLWKTVLSGNVWQGEFINRKKSGELYYEEATIAPILNDKDEIINFIAIKNDISQRKEAEELLKRSEENLKSAQSIGNVGHWEFNNISGDLFWSEQMYKIYELSPLEFRATYDNVVAMFHPEDRQLVEDVFRYSIQNKTMFEIEHRIVTANGKIKYLIERSLTKYDNNGNALVTLGSVADITQQKQFENELNSERVLLKSLIDSIPDFIFVKDINGAFRLINQSTAKAYGILLDDVIGKTDYYFYDKDIADFFREKDRAVMESGKTETNEEKVTFADGTEGWLETTKTPFVDAEGKLRGIIGISRDISERRKNEDELRQNRANLLALVENTNDSIWAIDNSFKIIYANLQFKNSFFTGYGVELKEGIDIIEALPIDLKEIWKSRYLKALKNERFIFEEEFTFGDLHLYFEISMNPILVDNKVIGVSVFSRDISKRKITETQLMLQNEEIATQNEELHQLNEELLSTNHALQIAKASAEESEELFSQLMNFSPIYIYIKDLNLRNIRLSYNYQNLFEKPIYQLLGKTNEEIMSLPNAQKITDDDMQVVAEGKHKISEYSINERIYTSIRFPILIEGKPRYVAGFVIDTTDRKNAEIKIQKQNEELIELNATKDKFFSIIAHDLRNPFNAILGFSDYLVNNIDKCSPDELKLFAGNINVSATMTFKLLENLLDWSRLQRGLVKANIKNHNLKEIANEVVLLHLDASNKKFIIIDNNITENLKVHCDLEMTKTILRNLISNAIKFTANDGTIILNAIHVDDFIEIQVIDNGVGIVADKIPFLFSIEKNTTTRGTDDEAGTGLGLLLCKELVESQGGHLSVQSTEGIGSTFCFTLKLSVEKESIHQ